MMIGALIASITSELSAEVPYALTASVAVMGPVGDAAVTHSIYAARPTPGILPGSQGKVATNMRILRILTDVAFSMSTGRH